MTRTQLEDKMRLMPITRAVTAERLTQMIIKAVSGVTQKIALDALLEVMLTAAKSRGMNLHALKEKSSWRPRECFSDNVYELLKVATSPRAVNAKIIILIGMVNDMMERRVAESK